MSSNIALLRVEIQEIKRELDYIDRRTRTIESSFLSLLSLTRQLSGSESLDALISLMLRTYAVGQSLLALLSALQAARAAAGDPTAILGLIIAAGGLAVSVSTLMEIQRPQY